MTDLTEKTIELLRKASDLAAVAYDNDLTEVEIDGAKVSTISLELQLRTLAAKLERRSQKSPMQKFADA
jgi:predicted nucleotidyltransferase